MGLGVAFSYTARHARHARARERHHRASRASSPFFVPPVHDRHARAAAAAALARSLDCARAVWRWRWWLRSVTPHVTRVTRDARHAFACARHLRAPRASSPPPSPMSTMRARGVRSLARSSASAYVATPHVRA